MKKILALVLALLMAVSTASMALATDTAAITEEAPKLISAATTYAEAIGMLDAYGIMKGVDPNTFDADADSDIQRYQMALFVGRISTGWTDDAQWTDGNVNNSGFTDLDGTAAQNFYGAISYASQKGIIEGYGDGKFGPTDGITYRDALTMVDRTLGYGGLKYPWGYIEKAEAIGLTKGITGVAYTDILNRGEVAQIIYNALSIPTAAGDTLGARYFGADLGWKTIIITATDRAAIDAISKSGDVPSGTVGFRVVKADGTLEGDTYYIAKEKLGIGAGAHDDEAQLGAAYRLLFTDDGTKLVKSLGEQKIFCGTIKNEGLFSKDADGKYPIEKALAGLSLTDKFTKINYVNVNNWNAGLIIVKSAIGNPVKTTTNKKYAIDWDNGNILVRNADGKIKDEEGNTWSVAWYYNTILEKYFKFKFTAEGEKVKYVGIDILDDISELGDLTVTSTTGGLLTLNNDTIKKNTAYAKLDLYDLTADGVADYGLYWPYRFGQYSTGKLNDGDGKEKDGNPYVYDVNVAAKTAWEIANPGKTYGDYASDPLTVLLEDYKGGKGYITGPTPAKGDFVIYGFNPLTGELHIEKIVDKDASDKTYIATGLVRAYDVNKRTVTIGNETLTYDYAELAGNPMFYDGDNVEAKAVYGAILNDAFMNIVEYVVVDGKLVYISKNVTNGAKYIVVDSYAGVSADGYIVVNAYRSDNLKYEQLRIGAYDQWLKGDLYNYAYKYDMNDLFAKQSVYKVTSYDAANDAYYVETGLDLTGKTETWEWKDGYKSKDSFATEERAKADDKYIFILDKKTAEDYGWAPVQVFTGKAADGSAFTGDKVTDNIYVNVKDLKGAFAKQSAYALTYGLLISANYDTAKYVSASEADGKLLLGATYYDATVLDLYKGELKTVKVLNKDLKKGLVYPIISGQIVARNGYNEKGFNADEVEISLAGTDLLVMPARPTWGYYTGTLTAKEIFNTDKALSLKLTGHKDNFATLKVFNVEVAADKTMKATQIDKASKLAAELDEYDVFVIYGWKGAAEGDNSFAIVYVGAKGSAEKTGTIEETIGNKLVTDPDGEDSYVTGSVTVDIAKKDGEITGKVAEIELAFEGKALEDTHKAVYNDNALFGMKDDVDGCKYEDWKTTVTVNGTKTIVYNSIAGEVYHEDSKDIPALKSVVIKAAADGLKEGDNTVVIEFQGAVPTEDAKTSAEWDGKYAYKTTTITLNLKVEKVEGTGDIAITTYKLTPEFQSGTVSGVTCTVK